MTRQSNPKKIEVSMQLEIIGKTNANAVRAKFKKFFALDYIINQFKTLSNVSQAKPSNTNDSITEYSGDRHLWGIGFTITIGRVVNQTDEDNMKLALNDFVQYLKQQNTPIAYTKEYIFLK